MSQQRQDKIKEALEGIAEGMQQLDNALRRTFLWLWNQEEANNKTGDSAMNRNVKMKNAFEWDDIQLEAWEPMQKEWMPVTKIDANENFASLESREGNGYIVSNRRLTDLKFRIIQKSKDTEESAEVKAPDWILEHNAKLKLQGEGDA